MKLTDEESLLILLDDPDEDVFAAVRSRILELGTTMLPLLELGAARASSSGIHGRFTELIRELRADLIYHELKKWKAEKDPLLIKAGWLITSFVFPDIKFDDFAAQIKPLRQEIWIELNEHLTALEKVRVLNHFFYGKYHFHINEDYPESPGNNFINRLIDNGKGNEFSLTLLYAIIGQELGLPVYPVDLPDYPILAYLDCASIPVNSNNPLEAGILFYINPANEGSVHGRGDIRDFLHKKSYHPSAGLLDAKTRDILIYRSLQRIASDFYLSGTIKRFDLVSRFMELWETFPDEK